MKKTTILSAITLLLCLLVGLATYEAANFVKNLISERLYGCQSETDRGCRQQNSSPAERERRLP